LLDLLLLFIVTKTNFLKDMGGRIEQEEIFSQVLRAGRRTYFFDVRSTKAEDYYL